MNDTDKATVSTVWSSGALVGCVCYSLAFCIGYCSRKSCILWQSLEL